MIMATFKDMCEHCSLSCVHKLPGMWKKIKNVHKLKLSALYSVSALPPAAARVVMPAYTHGCCAGQGRHCRAKDALRIGKHQLAGHGNTWQCKRAWAERAAKICSCPSSSSTGLNQNAHLLGGSSKGMTLKTAEDSRSPHPHSILILCSALKYLLCTL